MTESTLSPRKNQRQKPARTVRLTTTDAGTSALVIRQKQANGEQVDAYYLEPIPSQMGGRGFLLSKHDCTSYSVLLSGPDSTCDCRGFGRWGHCKHVESLTALEKSGQLS